MKATVSQFYNKNQFVIKMPGSTVFQSYDSTIAIIDENGLTLGSDWDYSHTTLKHLYLFIDEYVYFMRKYNIREKNNIREFLQGLIDEGVINYNETL